MSGQPYRYATDPEKFRQEYMDNITLQTDINQMNLDANRNYLTTGVLPAVSQMKDTRTPAEILADTLKLKAELKQELLPIGDPMFVEQIIQAIDSSPLNVDGGLFTFVAQRAPEIVKNLQKMYKYKIKGDTDDVINFVNFMEDMYNKTKTMTTTTKAYFNRPIGQADMRSASLTEGDLDQLSNLFDEISKRLLLKVYGKRKARGGIADFIADIAEYLQITKRFLKSDEYKILSDNFVKANSSLIGILHANPGLRDLYSDTYALYNEAIEEFPRPETLITLMGRLDRSIANSNEQLSVDILQEILGQLVVVNKISSILPALKELNDAINVETQQQIQLQQAARQPPLPSVPLPTLYPPIPSLSVPETEEFVQQQQEQQLTKGVVGNSIRKTVKGGRAGRMLGKGTAVEQQPVPVGGKFKQNVLKNMDDNIGIIPSPRYIRFGKFLINQQKLNNENVLAIKRPSGGNIAEFPSQRLSNNLSTVIKKMLGGSIPTFDELNKLSDPEKVYLQKVAKKANIMDKFSIPTPDKDKEEKDIHKFEVMKGQILSGNDNKELIKEFKLLLLKLSRNGSLPKREVSELLETLVELGY
jgi:hypothetical protein